MKINYKDKRYIVGLFMIFLQYLLFRMISNQMKIEVSTRNISFFIFIFLYFKEEIFYFKTCLIWEELRKQLRCFVEFIIIVSIIVIHLYGYMELWRYFILGILAFSFSLLIMKIIRKIFFKHLKTNLIIVGIGETARELTDIIGKNNFTMYDLKGYLNTGELFNQEIKIETNKILGSYNELENFSSIDEVIVALPSITDEEMNMIIDKLEGKVEKIKFIPKINKMYTFNPKIQDYDGVMLISAKNYMLSRKRQIGKRLVDILISGIGIILLIPLSIIIWLKTDKKEREFGIFFTQERIGYKGRKIKIYKYRSMVHGADKILEELMEKDVEIREEYTKTKKLKNDPRITKIGKFIRATSIDEFPQFINVLKNEMSFVGPRPYLFREIKDMGKSYKNIIQAKPGITGMWQTNGRNDCDFNERILLDKYYIRNWSLWLDIILIIKTIKNVIGKKGAY